MSRTRRVDKNQVIAPSQQTGSVTAQRPPTATGVSRDKQLGLSGSDDPVWIEWVDGHIDQCFGRRAPLPRAPRVARDKKRARLRVHAINPLPRSAQHMKVNLAQQRNRIPRAPTVIRTNQPQQRRKIVANVRMPRTQKAIPPDHGETHRVLTAITDAPRLPLIHRGTEQPAVSGNDHRAVGRVNPEPVDVLNTILDTDRGAIRRRGIATAATKADHDGGNQ